MVQQRSTYCIRKFLRKWIRIVLDKWKRLYVNDTCSSATSTEDAPATRIVAIFVTISVREQDMISTSGAKWIKLTAFTAVETESSILKRSLSIANFRWCLPKEQKPSCQASTSFGESLRSLASINIQEINRCWKKSKRTGYHTKAIKQQYQFQL